MTKWRMLNIKIYNTNVHIAVRNEVWIKFRGHAIVKISNSGSFGPNLYRRKYRKPSDPMYRGSNMQQDGNFWLFCAPYICLHTLSWWFPNFIPNASPYDLTLIHVLAHLSKSLSAKIPFIHPLCLQLWLSTIIFVFQLAVNHPDLLDLRS